MFQCELVECVSCCGCVSEEEGGSRSVKRYPQEEVINGGNEWNWPGPLCTILCHKMKEPTQHNKELC